MTNPGGNGVDVPTGRRRNLRYFRGPRSSDRRGRRAGGRVCGARPCHRLRMDVRARAEIRRGEVRIGRLVAAAGRSVGRFPDRAPGKRKGARLCELYRNADVKRESSFLALTCGFVRALADGRCTGAPAFLTTV